MDFSTFNNFPTVAITDRADLEVNCVVEAPMSAGQHGWHGNTLLASMTPVELEPRSNY